MIELPSVIVEKLQTWNKHPYDADVIYDKRFSFALLLAMVDESLLAEFDVPQSVKDFTYGKYI